ncbi:unnamed protein product [Arctogadus glacialis]
MIRANMALFGWEKRAVEISTYSLCEGPFVRLPERQVDRASGRGWRVAPTSRPILLSHINVEERAGMTPPDFPLWTDGPLKCQPQLGTLRVG